MTLRERIEIESLSNINWKCVTHQSDEAYLHIYFLETGTKPSFVTSEYTLLDESRKQTWGKGVDVRFDRNNYGQYNPDKDHLHVYQKGNELFAINKDGTAHDNSHKVRIPNKIADLIRANYPDFNLPTDNIIESFDDLNPEHHRQVLYLLEKQKNCT